MRMFVPVQAHPEVPVVAVVFWASLLRTSISQEPVGAWGCDGLQHAEVGLWRHRGGPSTCFLTQDAVAELTRRGTL